MLIDLPNEVLIFITFILGITFGSFITLASHRLPLGQDIIFASSQCTKCHHKLGFFDLFPILSWCFRGGRCSHCGVSVSARYPLIELATGLVFVITYLQLGITYQSILITLLGVALVILIVIDLEHKIIPDQLQIFMLALGIVYRLLPETRDVAQLLIGPIVGVGFGLLLRYIFTKWKKQEALGLGDVKFLAVVGIFLQIELIITFLFLAGVIGIFTALLWSAVERGKQFPFGPSLAVALYFCVLAPEVQEVVREYILSIMLDVY